LLILSLIYLRLLGFSMMLLSRLHAQDHCMYRSVNHILYCDLEAAPGIKIWGLKHYLIPLSSICHLPFSSLIPPYQAWPISFVSCPSKIPRNMAIYLGLQLSGTQNLGGVPQDPDRYRPWYYIRKQKALREFKPPPRIVTFYSRLPTGIAIVNKESFSIFLYLNRDLVPGTPCIRIVTWIAINI